MKILVRLPNWLGDMVMSVGFIRALHHSFPDAEISVIAKKGIDPLLAYFPHINHRFIFSKQEFSGLAGLYQFGRKIRREAAYDLFFCLPNSFSSALMGFATGARERIGYRNELRNVLLTRPFSRPLNLHRAEEYVRLLALFTETEAQVPEVVLDSCFVKKDYIVVNINSEASSRRLTVTKAVSVVTELRRRMQGRIILIGGPSEQLFVDRVYDQLPEKEGIDNVAGKTTLAELVQLLGEARLMLTTDSGPAHLANALCTKTVVLFGAGNEHHTAPFNKDFRQVMRLGKLPCEPCEKNVCVRYATPQCLEQLPEGHIVDMLKQFANENE